MKWIFIQINRVMIWIIINLVIISQSSIFSTLNSIILRVWHDINRNRASHYSNQAKIIFESFSIIQHFWGYWCLRNTFISHSNWSSIFSTAGVWVLSNLKLEENQECDGIFYITCAFAAILETHYISGRTA